MPNPFDATQAALEAYRRGDPSYFNQLLAPHIGTQVNTRAQSAPTDQGQFEAWSPGIEWQNPWTNEWQRVSQLGDANYWGNGFWGGAEDGIPAGREIQAYRAGQGAAMVGGEHNRMVNPYLSVQRGADGQYRIANEGSGYDITEDRGGRDNLMGLLAVAGGAWGLNALGGGAAGAGAGESVSGFYGPTAGELSAAGSSYGAGAGGAGAAGAAAGGAGSAGAATGAAGTGAAGAAGAAGTAAAGTAGAGGLASLLGSASGLLGPLATLAGAAAGAQGQQSSQSQTRDIPDWLKPYVTGQNGVLNRAQSLLDTQSAPGYLSGYDQMRTNGQNLLNAPIAGNGFSSFFPNFGGGQQASNQQPVGAVVNQLGIAGGQSAIPNNWGLPGQQFGNPNIYDANGRVIGMA